jgi:type VI secretion system secreted protein VgrG
LSSSIDTTNFPLRLEGPAAEGMLPVSVEAREAMSWLSETSLVVASLDPMLDLNKLLGEQFSVLLADGPRERRFSGVCVRADRRGSAGKYSYYGIELRPWLWHLTRRTNCRIFQDMKVPDILREVISDYHLQGRYESKTSNDYPVRGYTVQYRETDFAFLSRLMEEAGIFYSFAHDGVEETLVLGDDLNAYEAADAVSAALPYRASGTALVGQRHVSEWLRDVTTTSGAVALGDFDFEKPGVALQASKVMPQGAHNLNDRELYDHPGRFRLLDQGEDRAKVRMEAEAMRHGNAQGVADDPMLQVGHKLGVEDPPHEEDAGAEAWLAVDTLHEIRQSIDTLDKAGGGPLEVAVHFRAIPAAVQFRAPARTPWPEIPGVHTAIVTGPSGEEIHTDKYGRVKVKFHWDRSEATDDTSSCWIRCMTPWSGKTWGMVWLPRVGQEVVVQFEEGDPDRPLIVGMLYNAETMPPYTLPDDKTQGGVKTNSSTGGGGFNELMMEDKAGKELVRFQAERDYQQIVKNNATVTVGTEHKDKGDMTVTVQNDLTETVEKGDHSFSVNTGSQSLFIKTDKTEEILGKSTLTVTGNVSETIKQGNQTTEIKMGNQTTTLDMGNVKVHAKVGKIEMEAMQQIALTCGSASITMTPASIEVKAPTVMVKGTIMAEVNAPMTNVKGTGMVMIKGGVVMIN